MQVNRERWEALTVGSASAAGQHERKAVGKAGATTYTLSTSCSSKLAKVENDRLLCKRTLRARSANTRSGIIHSCRCSEALVRIQVHTLHVRSIPQCIIGLSKCQDDSCPADHPYAHAMLSLAVWQHTAKRHTSCTSKTVRLFLTRYLHAIKIVGWCCS